ncbi:MAG: hypothetical protein RLZ35_986 [Pseudomonadota bacterium]|jgi:electron-transferring-flavoprotein dehydrogenase
MSDSESMQFDVLIIGAGPAGLAAAIRLGQLSQSQGLSLKIAVLEKGASVSSHILSGAVFEPEVLTELLPNWKNLNAPLSIPATHDNFKLLTQTNAWSLPVPPQMRNKGHFIIRLGQLCRFLAMQAEQLGIEIFPGFAATELLFDDPNKPTQVLGVKTGDMGRDKHHQPKSTFQPGIALYAKYTLFAEGCRGSLTQKLIQTFGLNRNSDPQTYGLGIKEVWTVNSPLYRPGEVLHTVGWPLPTDTYGGSFLYHLDQQQVAVGFVVGLDYRNPYLSPFEEFQRFKQHPLIKPLLLNGKRIAYGARSLNEGGLQAIPELIFPGGAIIGCAAGFLNVPKLKGTHTAMKSGMLAAEAIIEAIRKTTQTSDSDTTSCYLSEYPKKLKQSWVWRELYRARNIRPAFRGGLWLGLASAFIDTYLLRGKAPWTFHIGLPDNKTLKPAQQEIPIHYPKPDNQISFDRASSLFLSHITHEENQISHLKIEQTNIPIEVNWQIYQSPEQRYCPAGVYEIIEHQSRIPSLRINAQNCIHCKACDIKDPTQNIEWQPPEGGSGPNYFEL